ncbi:MAG: TonB-dependent receptor [Acidobacteriota bacterium]|nr:TonB-dependent receptor [Acidobacteriota bacterium]
MSVLPAAFVLVWVSAAAAVPASRQPALDQDQRAGGEESSEDEEQPELPAVSETVVVTASRAESPLLTAPAAIAVRTEEELAAEAARTFADLFEGIPGISITGNARRITETPNIRGFADQQVVIRQDGGRQNFNAAHGGRFFTDPDLLQRVEVLRGANSAVFGSGALGGVVSLTTRGARDLLETGEDFGGRYRVGYQSNGGDLSQSFSGFAAGRTLDALVNVGFGGTRAPIRDGNGDTIPNTEDELRNGLVKLGWNPGATSRWEVSWQGFDNRAAEPTNANDLTGTLVDRDTRFEALRASFRTRSRTSDWLDLSVLGYRNQVEVGEDMRIRTRRDDTAFETLGFEAHNSSRFRWSDDVRFTLNLGAETYRDTQSGTRDGAPRLQFPDADATYSGAFLYGEAEVRERLQLALGLRRDSWRIRAGRFPARDEGQTSPRATAGFRLTDSAFVWVGASRGFRVPSLTELYADGLHFQFPVGSGVQVLNYFRPDPGLRAERGVSWEVGFRGGRNALAFETTCFNQTVGDYVDQIVIVADPALRPELDPVTGVTILQGSTLNVSLDARLRGCEGAALYDRPRFRMRASGSVLDTENLDTGEALGRAPANALHLMASTRIPSLDLEFGGRATLAGGRTRGLAASRSADAEGEAPGYRVLDLFLRFTPERGPLAGVDWTLALNNLTDQYYAVFPAVVPQPGRSLRVAAAYRFGFPR